MEKPQPKSDLQSTTLAVTTSRSRAETALGFDRGGFAAGSVLLGQLFTCTEQGGALVAEAADGRIVHIGDVPSGLACNCKCPGCGRRMIAYKGKKKAHYFGHPGGHSGPACASAGETALHKFAKRILNDRLEIFLPDKIVDGHGDRKFVVHAGRCTVESAIRDNEDGHRP